MEQIKMIVNKLPEQKEIEWHLERVQHYIDEFSKHQLQGTDVGAVLDDAISSCGKMLRPQMVLLAGEYGPKRKEAEERLHKLAAMIEMTHLSSLIHDDIIDDAPARRGKPSIQRKYGKDAAVYAGDFLMSRISYHIARENLNRSAEVLAQTIEEMCVGEIGQARCRYREDVTAQDYLRNIHGKTAALFMAACRIGAEEAGCDEQTVSNLTRFGECLGILFQLRDDLLDFTSSEKELGKKVHKDFRDGIYTMPVLCAMERPEGREALLPVMQANAQGILTDEQIAEMEKLVIGFGGVEATKEKIRFYRKEAETYVNALPPCRASKVMHKMLKKLEA